MQVHIPLWRPHLSPHVSHVHQDMWSWLRHRRLLSSCVFSGHSGGGISVQRSTILKCLSVLRASTSLRRCHVWSLPFVFGFPGSVLTAFSKGDACKRNQSAALPQSFLLFAEGARRRIPAKNQSGLRQHCCCCCCCCMVKHRGAPTVRYSLYIFTQGQIKIMWASPEGERECAVLVSRARGLQQPIIC